jgi:predicted SAM-dependent methyltransferase
MERLNLGAGNYPLKGWTNIDLKDADLRIRPWPWANDSIDEINASHLLEHFTKTDGFLFLTQCYRILKSGGALHLAVPDMDKFIACRLAGSFAAVGDYRWTDLNYLLGGDDNEMLDHHKHKYMYCEASLAWTLEKVGFFQVYRRHVTGALDNPKYAPISLYMEAVKP